MIRVQLQVRISTVSELCAHSQISLATTQIMQLACHDNLDHFALRSASWVWYWTGFGSSGIRRSYPVSTESSKHVAEKPQIR